MTYASDREATDEIFAVLHETWEAGSAAIAGYVPTLRWPGQFEDSAPPVDKIWGRVSKQTVAQTKANLTAGEAGDTKYTTDGFLTLQLFAPIGDPQGSDKIDALAELARNGYRARQVPGCAWFRNERKRELPNENKFYRINVSVEFQYDALGG